MKVGLHIVNQLHEITQAGYEVKFNCDFEGMIRIEYYMEHVPEFYEHEHLGCLGSPIENLEKDIINSLDKFRYNYVNKSKA